MVEQKKRYPNPKFRSWEEEDEYWKTHDPLTEGYEVKIQRTPQKRSSFLAVRLTGEELTRLRDMAAKQGLGTSTFARRVLIEAMEQGGIVPKPVTQEELAEALEKQLPESAKAWAEDLGKAVDEPGEPVILFLSASQKKVFEDFSLAVVRALVAASGGKLITPKDEGYEKVRELVEAKVQTGG